MKVDALDKMIKAGKSNLLTFFRVAQERVAQEKKWGTQNHSPIYWLGILGEEYGEVCKQVIEGDYRKARKELIQVAAVAIAMIESLERNQL